MGAAGLFAAILSDIGAAAATVAVPALEGAALGAGEAAITGGNIGKGALLGGLTGGIAEGVGGLGLGAVGSTALGGTAAGLITGQKPQQALLTGLEAGGASALTGAVKGALGGGSSATAGGGTATAAGSAAPSSVGAVSPDATATAGADVGSGATGGGVGSLGTGGGGAGLPGQFGQGAAAGGTGSLAGGVTGPDIVVNAPSGGSGISVAGGAGSSPDTALAGATLAGAQAGQNQLTQSQQKNPLQSKTGSKSVLDNLFKNPTTALAGVGLLGNVLSGNKPPEGFDALKGEAAQAQAQGRRLEGFLTSGTLPPGVQAGIDQARNAAEASIKSQYAARGLSGSSAEAQDIANLAARAQSQGAEIATQLYQQGVSQSQLGDQLFMQLMQTQQQQDQQTSQAIGSFASALAGLAQPAVAAAG